VLKATLKKIFLAGKYLILLTSGKIFGIEHIVRYARNPDPEITVRLLRSFGATIGKGTTLKRAVCLDNVYEDRDSKGDLSGLKIGNNVYVGDGVRFDLTGDIEIGNDVVVSAYASFITHADCNRSQYLDKKFPRRCKGIIVEHGAWIAYQATLLEGVTIGENAVVCAHALIRSSVEPYSMYGGVPARKIRMVNG